MKGQDTVQSEQDKQGNGEGQAPETAPTTANEDSGAPASANASGRKVFIGLGVGALVIIGAALAMQRTPQSGNVVGSTVPADITLITSDRADVDCSAGAGIETYRCGFTDENMPWSGDEKNKLKPFYTTDRHLYLIPGLFLSPAIEARYNSEPPTKPRDQLKRFTAKCNVKVIGKVANTRVRWLASAAWSNPEEIEVATVVDCKVDG
jgi:hypothetical protein